MTPLSGGRRHSPLQPRYIRAIDGGKVASRSTPAIRDFVGLAGEMRFQRQAVRGHLVRNEAAQGLIMDDPDRRSAII